MRRVEGDFGVRRSREGDPRIRAARPPASVRTNFRSGGFPSQSSPKPRCHLRASCNYPRERLYFLSLCLSFSLALSPRARVSRSAPFTTRIVTCARKRPPLSPFLSLSFSLSRRPRLSISRDECREDRRPTHATRLRDRSVAARGHRCTTKPITPRASLHRWWNHSGLMLVRRWDGRTRPLLLPSSSSSSRFLESSYRARVK